MRATRLLTTKQLITMVFTICICAPAGSMAQSSAAPTGKADATPIKHVVVIFQENVSFDHYFATYPVAQKLPGQITFNAMPGTPFVNGITQGLTDLNPNSAKPFLLTRAQNYTCDQGHDYTPEQLAFDMGLMDKFPENVGKGGTGCDYGHGAGLTMGYFDGGTVTGLWNYAQYFAMNQNFFGTTFGPSTPGPLNLVSGQTHGVDPNHTIGDLTDLVIAGSVIGDADPYYDDCGKPSQVGLTGRNVGDLLNQKGITWGWFQGGFKPTSTVNGKAVCAAATNNLAGVSQKDYSAHHEPFQYYPSTSNPHHLPPTSTAMIGFNDQANHQYDLTDFWQAVYSGQQPAVSFLKAKRSQDGHASYSSPLDEQRFIVGTLNRLQQLPAWSSTVVVIAYDDSDGWYDHQMSPILNGSATAADALNGPGVCGNNPGALGGYQGRCGYGPRLPMLVVSPFAKNNYVDGTLTDQSSILRYIEDNFNLGQIGDGSYDQIAGPLTNMLDYDHPNPRKIFLDPATGLRLLPTP